MVMTPSVFRPDFRSCFLSVRPETVASFDFCKIEAHLCPPKRVVVKLQYMTE